MGGFKGSHLQTLIRRNDPTADSGKGGMPTQASSFVRKRDAYHWRKELQSTVKGVGGGRGFSGGGLKLFSRGGREDPFFLGSAPENTLGVIVLTRKAFQLTT